MYSGILKHENSQQTFQENHPDFFHDLGLDAIADAILAGKEQFHIAPYFNTPPSDVETIYYRQSVFRDLENETLLSILRQFSSVMLTLRENIKQCETFYCHQQKHFWFLRCVEIYAGMLLDLKDGLNNTTFSSPGFVHFKDYLDGYMDTPSYSGLLWDADRLKGNIQAIRYDILLKGSSVKVSPSANEINQEQEVRNLFAKFRKAEAADKVYTKSPSLQMNSVEERIVLQLADIFKDVFDRLAAFYENKSVLPDSIISSFADQIQFYISYLDYIAPVKKAGMAFCLPTVTPRRGRVLLQQSFDLALAVKLTREGGKTIPNDVTLSENEQILVVTGPNQGGKSTFLRMFGQVNYLASLGLPVPGEKVETFFFDAIFTHFEREESAFEPRGKLYDELVRMKAILSAATDRSIIIVNEIFASTTYDDANYLGREILRRVDDIGALCAMVTFLADISRYNTRTVSLVGIFDDKATGRGTFTFKRREADGLAHAMAIAERHCLTFENIRERLS